MNPLTDIQLAALAGDLESDCVEGKVEPTTIFARIFPKAFAPETAN
jgi:hypothetical protein